MPVMRYELHLCTDCSGDLAANRMTSVHIISVRAESHFSRRDAARTVLACAHIKADEPLSKES